MDERKLITVSLKCVELGNKFGLQPTETVKMNKTILFSPNR
jgi:hypothetical protein